MKPIIRSFYYKWKISKLALTTTPWQYRSADRTLQINVNKPLVFKDSKWLIGQVGCIWGTKEWLNCQLVASEGSYIRQHWDFRQAARMVRLYYFLLGQYSLYRNHNRYKKKIPATCCGNRGQVLSCPKAVTSDVSRRGAHTILCQQKRNTDKIHEADRKGKLISTYY